MTSSSEDGLHVPVLPLAQFNELAGAVAACSGNGPQSNYGLFRRLAGAHQFLFLSQGTVHAWARRREEVGQGSRVGSGGVASSVAVDTGPDEAVWAALSIKTAQGDRLVDGSGKIYADVSAAATAAGAYLEVHSSTLRHTSASKPGEALRLLGLRMNLANLRPLFSSLGGSCGLGLHLRLLWPVALVDHETIAEALRGAGCHPYVASKIAEDLVAKGERSATVAPDMLEKIPELRLAMVGLGVDLKQTWVMPTRGARTPQPQTVDAAQLGATGPDGPGAAAVEEPPVTHRAVGDRLLRRAVAGDTGY